MAKLRTRLGRVIAHHSWVGRRLWQGLASRPVELEHDTALEDRLNVISIGKPMPFSEDVLGDHDAVEYVLILCRQDMRDLPNLLPVGAVNRAADAQRQIRRWFPKVHERSIFSRDTGGWRLLPVGSRKVGVDRAPAASAS